MTGSTLTVTDLDQARAQFRAELIEAGLLIATATPGLYGRSGLFEDIIDGVDAVIRAAGREASTETGVAYDRFRFPPVFPREAFDSTDYLASFPNLTGAISSFSGGDAEHAKLLAARDAGEPWDHFLAPSGTMLVSAACHPSYPMLTGTLPPGGRHLDILGYCFRHEPAVDPARMQAFRMHEYVHVGTEDSAAEHRQAWIPRGLAILEQLGLDAQPVIANDPFFGRAGRMLAANQRHEDLKTELVVRLYGDLDAGTAVVSCNCHRDHFGHGFNIGDADGNVAHSACVGFGMERIALALLRTHGTAVDGWPEAIRAALWL